MSDDEEEFLNWELDQQSHEEALDAEMEDEFLAERAEAESFLAGIAMASEHGMELDFISYVVRALRKGESMREAIWYATCEWDL